MSCGLGSPIDEIHTHRSVLVYECVCKETDRKEQGQCQTKKEQQIQEACVCREEKTPFREFHDAKTDTKLNLPASVRECMCVFRLDKLCAVLSKHVRAKTKQQHHATPHNNHTTRTPQ